jgi:hypothetical protein
MPAKRNASPKESSSTANPGFKAEFWLAADKLRNQVDAADDPWQESVATATLKHASN